MIDNSDNIKIDRACNAKFPKLLERHYQELKQSAISDELIVESNIESAIHSGQLKDLGFAPYQCRVPAILFPFYGVKDDHSIITYQIKPDLPRTDVKNGKIKATKYEYPAKTPNYIYCPPRYQPQLKNPAIPKHYTEGLKKALSLTSAGVCAMALVGVYSFRGLNELGGKTLLPDFEYIALNGCNVYLDFDNDSWTNPDIAKALIRFSAILKNRGAIVHIIRLPESEDKTKKMGVDDYLASGKTIDNVLMLESDERMHVPGPENPTNVYKIIDNCFHFIKETQNGESDSIISNFSAQIVKEVIKDDGIEVTRHYAISGISFDGRHFPTVETPVDKFKSLSFVNEWGAKAIITAGNGVNDRVREAIQSNSMDAETITVFKHTGFRKINESLVFLTHNNAIGADDISVDLEPQLHGYSLPIPNGDPKDTIKASLRMLDVGKLKVTLPLWAAMFLSPLCSILKPNFTLWYEGISGSFKSVLGALGLSHFGEFTYLTLPASWRDTANQLEKFQSLLKDLPLYIDDWAPGTDSGKQRELEAKADHVIRGQGNLQGKARMKADTSSRVSYTPRGLTISSGEQLPSGYSQSARMIVVEINRDDIDVNKLTEAQNEAESYSMAMAHYISWIIKRYNNLTFELKNAFDELRAKLLNTDCHSRLPGPIIMLYLGLDLGLTFATDTGAISQKEAQNIRDTGWDILIALGKDQSSKVNLERPSAKFLKALNALLESKQAILLDRNSTVEHEMRNNQTIIGYKDFISTDYIFLQPELADKAVKEFYIRSGKSFTVSAEAVWKDLRTQGLIKTKEAGRNTYAVRIPRNENKILYSIALNVKCLNSAEGDSDDELVLTRC